jgi:molecular chaperone DnaJ
MLSDNLYDVLKINYPSSREEIKKAYKELALKYHPDKNTKNNDAELFIKIKNAYEILIDDDKKMLYDMNFTSNKYFVKFISYFNIFQMMKDI